MGKKVYILGAGSSKHLDGPLNKDWIERIKSNPKNQTNSIAINFLNNLPGGDNLEALLTLIDLSIQGKHDYLPLSPIYDFKKLRDQIVECIVNVANEITDEATKDPLIREFFRKRNLKDGDTVINFNYDLAVDWGLYKTKLWSPYRGTKNGKSGYGFGITSIGNGLENDKFQQVPHSKIKYYKLHGSINWLLLKKERSEVKWELFDPQNISITNWCYSSPSNFIITPSFLKMFEDMSLRMLWRYAYESIAEATEIYIVGYSFPKADIVARQLLLYVDPLIIEKITVIDPLSNDCSETDKREDIISMLPWEKGGYDFWTKKIEIIKKTLQAYTLEKTE